MKSTFTLDKTTVSRLERTADRLGRSKSEVVREAIAEYDARTEKLTPEERTKLLADFDRLVPRIPKRPKAEIEEELAEIRRARRRGRR